MKYCKCIQKVRGKNNIILKYKLKDFNGNIIEIDTAKLKQAIRDRKVLVTNMQLTSDNRLITLKSDRLKFNLVRNLYNEIDAYKRDLVGGYCNDNGLNYKKFIVTNDCIKIIKDDLEDKGFSGYERWEFITGNIKTKTAYKILAYIYSIINEYDTIDELVSIIRESNSNIADFEKEDINQIFKSSMNLD